MSESRTSGSLMSGGGVDASIALQAGKNQAPNPLTQVGEFAKTLGTINQVKQGQLDLAQSHNRAAAAWMAPFLALPPEQQTRAAFTDMAARGENAGIAMGGFLHATGGIGDPDGRAFGQAVAPHIMARAQAPAEAINAIAPTQSIIGTGGQDIPMSTPRPFMAGAGNPEQVGPGITRGLTVEQQITPRERPATAADVAIFAKQGIRIIPGQTLSVPQLQWLQEHGPNPGLGGARVPIGGQVQSVAAGAAPPSGGGGGQPRIPVPGSAAPGGPILPGPPPGVLTGPIPPSSGAPLPAVVSVPPSQPESQAASAKMYDVAIANDAGFNQRKLTLNEAYRALKSTKTGPGTGTTQQIFSFLKTHAPAFVPKSTGDAVTDFDLAVKNLAAWAAQQPGALNSNMHQELVQTANASTGIDNAAARHVVQLAMGLQNMDHAAVSEFEKTQGGQAASSQFLPWYNRTFTPNHNPLGYVWGNIDYPDRVRMLKQYDTKTRQQIKASYDKAVELGLTPEVK